MTDTLPFTSRCPKRHNFPNEYGEPLKWQCTRYDGHGGECTPTDQNQRWYDGRVAIRDELLPPGEFTADEKVLREIVKIAVNDNDDVGVMWLRIRRLLGFNAWMRSLSDETATEQSQARS